MPGGRPTVMTDMVIAKLEEAFLLGCTDTEACLAAGIVPSTMYRYIESNPEFSERKETLKLNPVYKARTLILKAIEEGDTASAHKVIDRKEGSKVAITGAEGGPIQITRIQLHVIPITTHSDG